MIFLVELETKLLNGSPLFPNEAVMTEVEATSLRGMMESVETAKFT